MGEIVLDIASRQVRRMFERAMGRDITKILTELITNADDSYCRLAESAQPTKSLEYPAPITIVFDRTNRRFSVIDHAEGMTEEEMRERFATYGKESLDRTQGFRTRSLFGKGLRDVLFTQKYGQVKSIKNGMFYNCRFRWKEIGGRERPVIDLKSPMRATPELRAALQIPKNGTLVEFELKAAMRNPQPDKLVEVLSTCYMLRPINSSADRVVTLQVVRRSRRAECRTISYQSAPVEVMDKFNEVMTTDLGTEIRIEGEVGLTSKELTQGEVPNTEREGGVLVLDEDGAVLDLQLFGFDTDPAARCISGTLDLLGVGQYIRAKLNQSEPEEVLTETRDGFNQQHPFYRDLREILHPRIQFIVLRLREIGPKQKVNLSERTRERHQQALDLLNRLASEMLGATARIPVIPTKKRIPPAEGIQFANEHVVVKVGLVTPVALLINTQMVGPTDVITIGSDRPDVHVEPQTIELGKHAGDQNVAVKILRIKSDVPNVTAHVTARWRNFASVMIVSTTEREILTPVDGIEFEHDEYNVRLNDKHFGRRNLRLFVDISKIPVGSEITFETSDPALKLGVTRAAVTATSLVAPMLGEIEFPVTASVRRKDAIVTATVGEYTATTTIQVVKREKPERGKQGLFRGYQFEPLERKVQTLWNDGYVLINTNDPVNARYFGEDPGKSLEEKTHCQVLLADLILNECLQVMVSQALELGRLDTRFPNNPEIDLRTYVDEKKYDIGLDIHSQFVPKI